MMDDQTTIDVDDALHVVAGRLGRMPITHRPGVGLAETRTVSSRFFRISCRPTSRSEALDRSGERLPMLGLIIETLSHRLVHNVEALKVVGALLFGMSDITGEPPGACDVLWARDRAHLCPV